MVIFIILVGDIFLLAMAVQNFNNEGGIINYFSKNGGNNNLLQSMEVRIHQNETKGKHLKQNHWLCLLGL